MICLAKTIRFLRKKKGLTQEQLAAVLNISPKTVSKWETAETFPDMTLIPVLAEFFEVSLDTLFGYEPAGKKKKLEEIFAQTRRLFWNDFDACESVLKNALEDYPSDDELRHTLLNLYECHMRNFGRTDRIDEGIALARNLIETSEDFLTVCDAKDDLASFLLKKGRYDEAKEVLLTLPDRPEWSYESRAFRLHGQDRLDAALPLRNERIEDLYAACSHTGEGYFETGNYEMALRHFREAVQVIEIFMKSSEIRYDSYLWSGMQTHHWYNQLGIAASLYRLGRTAEADAASDRAYFILSHAWDEDFEEEREEFLEPFREYFAKFGLDAYRTCP